MPLSGKKILITGANGGLGRAIAKLALEQGAHVALSDRTPQLAADALAAQAQDTKAVSLAADLTQSAQTEAMVAQAIEALDGLDGIVANHASLAADDSTASQTPMTSWQETLDVNLTGTFRLYKAALPFLVKQQSGALVTLSSVVAHSASAVPQIAYTASKGALEAMTREIAMTHARDNVRANCVAPGPVKTERTAHYFDSDEKWEMRRRHIPMGRLGRPEEIAALVCFLLSDGAGWQTGGVYRADGGISASYLVDDRNGSDTP